MAKYIGDNNDNILTGSGRADKIYGYSGNDLLHGEQGNDIMFGGDGNDTLYGDKGSDSLDGGVGDDLLYGGSDSSDLFSRDVLIGGDGNDTLYGGSGYEILSGGNGNDYLDGGATFDRLDGGDGNDDINGGEGGDNLQGGLGDDTLSGGAGIDTADYFYDTAGVNVNLMTGVATGMGLDTLIEIERVWGSYHDDVLTGDDADNQLIGSGGNDLLNGGAGNDWLQGDGGSDRVNGDDGDDNLYSADGGDIFDGGAGIDTLHYFGIGDGIGGAGQKNIGAKVNLLTGLASNGSGSNDTVTGVENINGWIYNDKLTGDNAANQIIGEYGKDVLAGEGGEDTLLGGGDNDILFGGEGRDLLSGGEGKDKLVLTETIAATDTVLVDDFENWPSGSGYDTVSEFALGDGVDTDGCDQLDFAGFINIAADADGNNGVNFGIFRSHAVSDGIASFDFMNQYSAPIVIKSAAYVGMALKYLQANFTSGEAVAFTALGNTYVFQDNGSIDEAVQLTGVTAINLSADGLAIGGVWLV